MKFVVIVFAIIASGSFCIEAFANPIGNTVAVATLVTASGPSGRRSIKPNSPIFSDDRLKANSTGNAQIILIDKTKIVVGPGAELRIDDFVFDTNKTFKKIAVSVSKGAFRFISGKSKSRAYTFKTPTGTIGIRGTAFDVTIKPEGAYIALLSGALRVCDRRRKCREIRNPCNYLLIGKRGIKPPSRINGVVTRSTKELFPFLKNQRHLKANFRRSTSGCSISPMGVTPRNVQNASVQAVVDQPKNPPGNPGNPGNNKGVGNAGETPGKGDYGNGQNGRGDTSNGNGNGNGKR